MAQKPFATLDLSGDYIVHDVALYAHNHPTEPDDINAAVKTLESTLQAFDLDDYDLGGDGDMLKATYDANANDIVDEAENLNDGTYTVLTADVRDHLDNHPSGGDTVGGYVTIATTRPIVATELEGHMLLCTGGIEITLPDVTTLPGNARCDIVVGDASTITIGPYNGGKSGADRFLIPGSALADGVKLQSSGSIGDHITLRKDASGWIATCNTGFTQQAE